MFPRHCQVRFEEQYWLGRFTFRRPALPTARGHGPEGRPAQEDASTRRPPDHSGQGGKGYGG